MCNKLECNIFSYARKKILFKNNPQLIIFSKNVYLGNMVFISNIGEKCGLKKKW